MDVLNEVYTILKSYGYCKDQQDFSRNWLGRSDSYYAHLRSSGQSCSVTSLGMLAGLLREIIPTPDDKGRTVERQHLASAWTAAEVMYRGEWELLHLRPSERVTAIALPDWVDPLDR